MKRPEVFPFSVVGVVGLGLIGGSMAKAAAQTGRCEVLGHDRDETALAQALADGALTGGLTPAGLLRCDLLLLALYPRDAVEFLRRNAQHLRPGAVVVDLCGVKRAVAELGRIAQAAGLIYVGGHPMAGTERWGYAHSTARLFEGASMILTTGQSLAAALPGQLEDFFSALGFATLRWSTADEHDRLIAYTSQLPHLLSSAYVMSPTAPDHAGFSAGSFRDMSRVAWLNETMWTELFLANADRLADEAEGMAERLGEFVRALRGQDAAALQALLLDGKRCREALTAGEVTA